MKTKHNNNKPMNNFLKIGMLAAVLVACGEPELTPLDKLYEERDSLAAVQNEFLSACEILSKKLFRKTAHVG
jgi:thymidine phosphorylase